MIQEISFYCWLTALKSQAWAWTLQTEFGYLQGPAIDYEFTSYPIYVNYTGLKPGAHNITFKVCDLDDALLDTALFINNVNGILECLLTTSSPTRISSGSLKNHYPFSACYDHWDLLSKHCFFKDNCLFRNQSCSIVSHDSFGSHNIFEVYCLFLNISGMELEQTKTNRVNYEAK